MRREVAQGVEEEVADEVRDGQVPLAIESHESRAAAAVGYINSLGATATTDCLRVGGRQEEGIRVADQTCGRFGKAVLSFEAGGGGRAAVARLARLDVLRAVAKALGNRQCKTFSVDFRQDSVCPIASACVRLQAEHAYLRTGAQIRAERISWYATCVNTQVCGVRTVHEPGWA